MTTASSVLTKTQVWTKGGEKLNSPSKRNVLGDVENHLPSSPDLLLSVPETPNSQIRLSSPEEEVACRFKVGQLSPVCRSPSSKGPKLRHVLTKNEERTKKAHRLSGPLKRLFSPPEESHSAKRVKNKNSPLKHVISSTTGGLKVVKPTDPVNTPQRCSDQPDGSSETLICQSPGKTEDRTTSRNAAVPHSMGAQRKLQEEEGNAECDFTVITELKAAEAQTREDLQSCTDDDISTVAACAQTGSGGEHVLKGKETTKTLETDGDGSNKTSSEQEQATGMPRH